VILYEIRSTPLPNAKILLVDDNPCDTNVLCMALSGLNEDVEVEIVTDGQKALEFVHIQRKTRDEAHPCLIVLDLHLPRHDGIEILRAIREEPVLSHVHVVVLTGTATSAERAELDRMGAHYRTKPMNLSGYDELATDLLALCKGLQVAA
jgi:chemotaxis family two-component system response regulator Rcp1